MQLHDSLLAVSPARLLPSAGPSTLYRPPPCRRSRSRALIALTATIASALPVSAAALNWDADGILPVTGGTGIWNTSTPLWEDGAGNYVNWNNATPDSAILGGTGGTVSLGEGITASSLAFNSNNYIVDLNGFSLTVTGTTGGTAVLLASNTITNTSPTLATFTTGTLPTQSPRLSGNMAVNYTGGGWNSATAHDFTGTLSFLGTGLVRSDGTDLGINSGAALLRMGGTQTLQLGAVGSQERVYARNIELLVTGGGIQTNGGQNLFLTGNISGTGNFNRLGGQGLVILSGNNTFTGKVSSLTGGAVLLAASANAFGAENTEPALNVVEGGGNSNTIGFMGNVDVAGTKRITLGGSFRADGLGNLYNLSGTNSFAGGVAISNNMIFMVEAGSQLTLKGVLSGTRALNKHGGGTLVLANQMTVTNGGNNGAFRELVNVFDGTLLLDFSQPTSPDFGIINAAQSITAAQPAFSGGIIEIRGAAGEANSDFFDDGLLVNVGASEFKITQNGAASVGARLGSMGVRSPGGTLDFTLAQGDQTIYTVPQTGNGFTTTKVNANGILGGYATVAKTSWATTGNFAGTYNITAYAHTPDEQGLAAFATPTNNVDVTAANTTALISGSTVNSLRFAAGGTVPYAGVNVITSGGILVTGASGGSIVGGTLQGGASADLIVQQHSPARFNIASNISDNTGPTGLTKSGLGTLALSGVNDYTGATFVLAGVLLLDSATALPGGVGATGGTSKLVLKGGMVGLTSDFARTIGTGLTATSDKVQWLGSGGFAAYGGTRTVNLGGTAAWHNGNYDGNNVVQTAGGYQGGFVPYGSKLIFGAADADGTIDFQSNINLANNNNTPLTRVIEVVDSASALVEARITGILSGTGFAGLTKTGNGALELAAANTYTGHTIVEGGALHAGAPNSIPNTPLFVRAGAVNLNGFAFAAGNGVTLGGGATGTTSAINTGVTTFSLNSNLTYAGNVANDNGATINGNVDLGAITRVFTVHDSTATANDLLILGDISGAGGLTKTGAGSLQLVGTSSYSGATTIAQGALGVTGFLSGSSPVLITGGTLTGTGGVGVVTLTSGAIAPGNGAGTENTADLLLNGGALQIELTDVSSDQINVFGAVQFGGPVSLSLAVASTFAANSTFTIISNNLTDPVTFADALSGLVYNGNALEEGEIFNVTGAFGSQAFQISYADGLDDNDVVLTAVPEPASALLLIGGIAGLAGARRRRAGEQHS